MMLNKISSFAISILIISVFFCACEDECRDAIVSEVPIYRSIECDELEGEELNDCASQELLSDIYSNLEYPQEALQDSIEGSVFVKFNIDRTGVTSDHEIESSLGFGCDEEAVRLMEMLEFFPAKNSCGEVIVSTMTINVKFLL